MVRYRWILDDALKNQSVLLFDPFRDESLVVITTRMTWRDGATRTRLVDQARVSKRPTASANLLGWMIRRHIRTSEVASAWNDYIRKKMRLQQKFRKYLHEGWFAVPGTLTVLRTGNGVAHALEDRRRHLLRSTGIPRSAPRWLLRPGYGGATCHSSMSSRRVTACLGARFKSPKHWRRSLWSWLTPWTSLSRMSMIKFSKKYLPGINFGIKWLTSEL